MPADEKSDLETLIRQQKKLAARLDAIERSLEKMTENLAVLAKETRQARMLNERAGALAGDVGRLVGLRPDQLDFPYRLTARRFRVLSQFAEDGLTLAVFEEAGVATRTFVEIGCGPNGGNSGFFAAELGWSGLMVDANPDCTGAARQRFPPGRVEVATAWVTREEVNELVRSRGLSGEIDLLSIDLDGNDYWVWEALDAVSPRLVIIECNLLFGADRSVVVPYDPKFDRHDRMRSYFGASLGAIARLGERKGYRLIALENDGPNAYLLRDDVAPEIPAVDPRDVYHQLSWVIDKRLHRSAEFGDPIADLYDAIQREGLELMELDE